MSESDLYQAVLRMANALGTSESALSHFTCEEVDTMVAVLAVAGLRTQAMGAVIGHASGYGPGEGDEEDDLHAPIAAAWWDDEDTAIHLAREYVIGLLPEHLR